VNTFYANIKSFTPHLLILKKIWNSKPDFQFCAAKVSQKLLMNTTGFRKSYVGDKIRGQIK